MFTIYEPRSVPELYSKTPASSIRTMAAWWPPPVPVSPT